MVRAKAKGRLTSAGQERRDKVEAALFALSSAIVMIDEVILRVNQAMRRTRLVDPVLVPALERLVEIRADVVVARQELSDYWSDRQSDRWAQEVNNNGWHPDE